MKAANGTQVKDSNEIDRGSDPDRENHMLTSWDTASPESIHVPCRTQIRMDVHNDDVDSATSLQ